jgi:hypothetical protein
MFCFAERVHARGHLWPALDRAVRSALHRPQFIASLRWLSFLNAHERYTGTTSGTPLANGLPNRLPILAVRWALPGKNHQMNIISWRATAKSRDFSIQSRQ